MDDLISRQELLNRTINNPLHPPYITERDVLNCPSAESELENKIRAIGYTGKEGRIYIGGRLFAVRELAQ